MFSYIWNMGYEKIYELAVINYPAIFWQYHDRFVISYQIQLQAMMS